MCLFSRRPAWEEDVVFMNRPSKRRSRVVTETIVRERSSPRPAQFVQAPRASTPIIRPATPPKATRAPSPLPAPRIELVEVEERKSSPRTSKAGVSVSNANTKRSRRGSRGGEEVYIERERERVRLEPEPRRSADIMVPAYRYVEGAPPRASERYIEAGSLERSRSRSITYETNPRTSGRLLERERVVVEDGGRRREYYRRP